MRPPTANTPAVRSSRDPLRRRTAILLVANAVGLLVAAALLEGMKLDLGSYFLAVIIFTVAFA